VAHGRASVRVFGPLVVAAALLVLGPGLAAQSRTILRLGPEPALRIGSIDGPLAETFEFLVDARLLGDSALVVADRTAAELRVFDRAGRIRAVFGGRGQGPGEFSHIDWIEVVADTIIVHDPRLGRLTRFTTAGEFLSTSRVRGGGLRLIRIDASDRHWWQGVPEPSEPRGSIATWSFAVHASDGMEGNLIDLGRFEGQWRGASRPYPLSPIPSLALLGDSLLVSQPASGQLVILAPGGSGRRIVNVPLDPPSQKDAWSALEKELRNRGQESDANELSDFGREATPRFGMVLVEGPDRIWVKRFDPLEDAHWLGGWAGGEGGSWLVLDRQGTIVQEVELLARAVPLWIGEGVMLARLRDELDVQYLALYEIPESRD